MANHYPIIGRSVPGSCNDAQGTANPFAPVTCSKCRERLAIKVKAHTDTSASYRPGTQHQRFFAADAAHWATVLAQ